MPNILMHSKRRIQTIQIFTRFTIETILNPKCALVSYTYRYVRMCMHMFVHVCIHAYVCMCMCGINLYMHA